MYRRTRSRFRTTFGLRDADRPKISGSDSVPGGMFTPRPLRASTLGFSPRSRPKWARSLRAVPTGQTQTMSCLSGRRASGRPISRSPSAQSLLPAIPHGLHEGGESPRDVCHGPPGGRSRRETQAPEAAETPACGEIGYLPIDRFGASLSFRLSRATTNVITSNQSLTGWGQVFGDRDRHPRPAAALLDDRQHQGRNLSAPVEAQGRLLTRSEPFTASTET